MHYKDNLSREFYLEKSSKKVFIQVKPEGYWLKIKCFYDNKKNA